MQCQSVTVLEPSGYENHQLHYDYLNQAQGSQFMRKSHSIRNAYINQVGMDNYY